MCEELSPCSGHTGSAPHRGVFASPVCPARAPRCSLWSGPCAECGSSFQLLHKSADSAAPAFCASYLQPGWGGSSLEFLSPFVLRTAGGVFGPVNFSSLSHSLKELPPTALRAFWPVPTLRNAAGSSPFRPLLSVRPLLLVAGAGVWGYFSAGSCF